MEERELVLKLDGKQIDNESLQSIFERRCETQVRPLTLQVVAVQASRNQAGQALEVTPHDPMMRLRLFSIGSEASDQL